MSNFRRVAAGSLRAAQFQEAMQKIQGLTAELASERLAHEQTRSRVAELEREVAEARDREIRALYDHRATLLDAIENAGEVSMGPVGRRKLKAVEKQINDAERAEATIAARPDDGGE